MLWFIKLGFDYDHWKIGKLRQCKFFSIYFMQYDISDNWRSLERKHVIRIYSEKKIKVVNNFCKKAPDSSEVVVWGCSVKNVFLRILQNSHESTCARVSVKENTYFLEHLRWLLLILGRVLNTPLVWHLLVKILLTQFLKVLNPLVRGTH